MNSIIEGFLVVADRLGFDPMILVQACFTIGFAMLLGGCASLLFFKWGLWDTQRWAWREMVINTLVLTKGLKYPVAMKAVCRRYMFISSTEQLDPIDAANSIFIDKYLRGSWKPEDFHDGRIPTLKEVS
ncbi:hypothetical protein D3C87_278500 [compost metagenome]